ncbi:Growth-regulating factor 6 [Platanthera guangdongensis]|uniref:Growth-regulating factor n=1 Tax=Platanthera guangdongensis TaxID=2320717 RepID=A0ABR2LD78_9ASPA
MDLISSTTAEDGLVSSEQQQQHSSAVFPSEASGLFGSGFSYKHGRSSIIINNIGADEENDDECWSRWKISRVVDPMRAAACLPTSRSTSHSLFPADSPQMLNFSSWKPDAAPLAHNSTSSPFFTHSSPPSSSSSASSLYHRDAGLVRGLTGAGSRGGFTHSQWFELERQALIYKYIDAKVPVPSYLLIPSVRSSSLFPSLTAAAGSAAARYAVGWGSLHLGFSGNAADPEPGRCRRTDGKKWRCSRDAVHDQKYCERHMNRGRHRSRKRVEGQSGRAGKVGVPAITSSQSASALSSRGSSSNNLISPAQKRGKSITDPSSLQLASSLMNKLDTSEPNSQGPNSALTFLTRENSTPVSKNQNPFEIMSSGRSDFGLISTDSQRSYSSENLTFIQPDPKITDHQCAGSRPFRHFIDDWSKNQSNDKTELSISIPMASSDFSSSSSSPNQKKMSFSPLRLSCEFNPLDHGGERDSSWIPISWEPTVGGPLGEVLTNTASGPLGNKYLGTPKDHRRNLSSSSLNLLTDGWTSSRRFESSPTGVLQKSGFGSLSSSARSSPRAENFKTRMHESDELLSSINPC